MHIFQFDPPSLPSNIDSLTTFCSSCLGLSGATLWVLTCELPDWITAQEWSEKWSASQSLQYYWLGSWNPRFEPTAWALVRLEWAQGLKPSPAHHKLRHKRSHTISWGFKQGTILQGLNLRWPSLDAAITQHSFMQPLLLSPYPETPPILTIFLFLDPAR